METKQPPMVPTVHLNGTSKEALLEQLQDARAALGKAAEAVAAAYPHGRDYYPQSAGAIHRASAEHRDRLARINSVLEEIEIIARGVRRQGRDAEVA